jgi:hypothetical protein
MADFAECAEHSPMTSDVTEGLGRVYAATLCTIALGAAILASAIGGAASRDDGRVAFEAGAAAHHAPAAHPR